LIAKLIDTEISDIDNARTRLLTIAPTADLLLSEIQKDLNQDKTGLIRELVVLSSPTVIFNNTKPRFVYYESKHPNLQLIIDRLEDMGFVDDVTYGNTPMYRMTPDFVAAVRTGVWKEKESGVRLNLP
jgi:hypothetical protein